MRRSSSELVIAAAAAAVGLMAAGVRAGETPGAVTVSLSGSTAMRNFTISPDFSALTPGTSITVGVGPNARTYTAAPVAPGQFPAVQLAHNNTATADPHTAAPVTGTANFLAYRVEWHEQGSVEGIAELANDQIGYFSPLVPAGSRNPAAAPGNAIYLQRNVINATPFSGNGFALNSAGYNTYNASEYSADGTNLLGGQNRVQMAISDVRAVQGFSVAGQAAFDRRAGQAGYGKGNPALAVASGNALGLGSDNVRRQLIDQTALNMETTKVDPKTGANYAPGAWNTAGIDNTQSRTVAVSATTFAANPGTGLTDLNKTDAQWLQAAGRLANGADFNVVTRDINSGTLNVAANNVGLDPSFAVGENDDGNGLGTANQTVIGGNIRFSGKTSGGSQLRPTVQNARMAVGHLGLSDVRAVSVNSAANPLRALGYSGSVAGTSATAVQPSIDTISNGTYALFQNQTYVTIKDPTAGQAAIDAARPANPGLSDAQIWARLTDAQTGIKGDNAGQDVADFRGNILQSAAQFPLGSSFRNPANGLLTNAFIPERFMQVTKTGDGETPTPNANFDSANYGTIKAAYEPNFAVGAAGGVTSGASASRYGTGANAIPVTTNNYLFGDFNGDTVRDYKDIKTAQSLQQAINAGGLNVDYNSGAANGTVVSGSLTKGDLIVKGDYNADGRFDGRDLYAIARGTALADSGLSAATLANPDNAQLTAASGATVSDRYRGGTLYKNAALDYLQSTATAAQKAQATSNSSLDPSGANAFNKFDVNRDGLVNRQDAAIVDGAVGKDYRNLGDQLGSVVATNVNASGTVFVGDPALDATTPRKGFSLVDAELTDNGLITNTVDGSGNSDFKLIRQALGTSLLDGDANFSGGVDSGDLNLLLSNYSVPNSKWGQGDFTFDGGVDSGDLNLLLTNFSTAMNGMTLDVRAYRLDLPAYYALADAGFNLIPEPASIGVLGVAAAGLIARRRKARTV